MVEGCPNSRYQVRDAELVDYQLYELDGTGLWLRGPKPKSLRPRRYIACIGAAQTFGCFCELPFPRLIESALNIPVLNLGFGGAGPEFFLKHASLWSYISEAQLVIVQVMSGRSVSNSEFDSGGLEYLRRRSDGRHLGADASYREILEERRFQDWFPPWRLGGMFLRLDRFIARNRMRFLVVETRKNWIAQMQLLLCQIRAPKILFWFSQRNPDYVTDLGTISGTFGSFPQLVNRTMVEMVCSRANRFVQCVTSRGMPQPHLSRFSGLPVVIEYGKDRSDLRGQFSSNTYYPSPEMHEDAADVLIPELVRLINESDL